VTNYPLELSLQGFILQKKIERAEPLSSSPTQTTTTVEPPKPEISKFTTDSLKGEPPKFKSSGFERAPTQIPPAPTSNTTEAPKTEPPKFKSSFERAPNQTPAPAPTTTTVEASKNEPPKFKFGGEKPTFVGVKTSEKKPIVKTEEDLKKEQIEREVEERLLKQKEEEQKRTEERLAKKAKREEETGIKEESTQSSQPTTTPVEGTKIERLGFSNTKRKEHHEDTPKEEIKEDNTNGQEVQTKLVRKNPKPKNHEENGDKKERKQKKPKEEKLESPKKEDEVKEEVKVVQPHDVIAVTATSISTANWDTGLKKIPKKK